MVQHQHSWPSAHSHAVGTVVYMSVVAAATIMVTIHVTGAGSQHIMQHAAALHAAARSAAQ